MRTKMKTISLKTLAQRAQRDKRFFNALVKDPTGTLKAAHLRLSEADRRKLMDLVRKARRVSRLMNIKPYSMLLRPICWPPIR